MIEVDSRAHPHQVEDLEPDAALCLLADTVSRERAVERTRLRLVLRLVQSHLVCPAEVGLWERLESGQARLEWDRRPEATASVQEQMAGVMATTGPAVQQWIDDALDLRFRLPRLHALLESLAVAPWKARRVARLTHTLAAEAAAWVDEALADRIETLGAVGIEKVVALAIAMFDPDRLEALDRQGRSGWHVKVAHPGPVDYAGTGFLDASADSLDLADFEAALRQIAAEMAACGDEDPLQVRLAKALGVLARRAAPDIPARIVHTPEEPLAAKPPTTARTLQVYLRTTSDGAGAVRLFAEVPRWGCVPEAVLDRWLSAHDVRVTRVVDLGRGEAVDVHDPPVWMRELVIARDRHCVFPGCTRDAGSCDLDHIAAYQEGGPPGQTSPANLAPLCRHHHLLKTHAGWRYRRDRDGTYLWHDPRGRIYLVDTDGGTHHLIEQAA